MDEFAAALKDLKAFNRMIADHPELSARLIGGDHDYLQWRQARLFVAFRERHRKSRAAPPRRRRFGRAKHAFAGFLACALTAWAALARGRKDALVFSVDKISAGKDHDFRIDGIYRFLTGKGIGFTEVFHTQPATTLAHARSRKRSAVYREAFAFMASVLFRYGRPGAEARRLAALLPCEGFDEADRPYMRAQVEKLLRGVDAARLEVRWYRRIIRRIRPKVVLAIDDTRYYQELCAAARAEGVPFYAFQHGHFTKYHAGWLSDGAHRADAGDPDALFVWSPYWKKELLRLGTHLDERRIRVGGNPKGDAATDVTTTPPPADGPFGLLVPFESDVPFDEMKVIMRALLSTERVKIWLKTRPDWDAGEQMRRYGLDGLSAAQAEAVPDHLPILDRVHAVAGVYSTFLYDALPSLRPVFIFKTSMDLGEGMLVNGLADLLDASAPDLLARLHGLRDASLPKLKDRLERYRGGEGRLTATLESLEELRRAG